MLFLCLATALIASGILYYLGWSSPVQNPISLTTTPTSTSTDIRSDETLKTATKTPVVVPSKELNVTPAKTCKVGGCSGEICSDKEMLSNCMYRSEYSCYKKAKCEVQPRGECGWTPSTDLNACLHANVDATPLPQ